MSEDRDVLDEIPDKDIREFLARITGAPIKWRGKKPHDASTWDEIATKRALDLTVIDVQAAMKRRHLIGDLSAIMLGVMLAATPEGLPANGEVSLRWRGSSGVNSMGLYLKPE